MEEKEMVIIENSDGSTMEVELVTYLMSDDRINNYLVYSKGEKNGAEEDEVIYISKILQEGEVLKLAEITDDNEWLEVQKLLKKIANN
ncbi:MAG: DUF1292 domain-containing protein [Bacilli bacterium]|nr:DUF1292 domain-containing protein [Bacilli bacterium]